MTLLTTWAQTALVWVLQSIYKFYKATKVVWDPLWDLMGSPLEVGARRAYSAAFLSRLPPGPEGRTFWGILCGMAEPLHLLVQKFRARFGDCLSFYMGGECMVVLSSYKMVKKAFTGEALAWRPQIPALVPLLQGYGIVNSEGPLWRENRAFICRMTFGAKNSGNPLKEMQNCVQKETVEMLQLLRSECSKNGSVDPDIFLSSAFSNVVCSMAMSTRFNHDDPEFVDFMKRFDEGFKLCSDTGALCFIPILKIFPGVQKSVAKLYANHAKTLGFVKRIVDEHKKELDVENPKDLIDNYLIKLQQEGADSAVFRGCRDPYRQIEQVMVDLFSAGVETVKTTTKWAMVYMLHNAEVMRKVQAELDEVVGSDRLPEWSDRRNLPYTQAAINEVMRLSAIVSTGTTHSNKSEMSLFGHTIPKRSHVVPNIYGILHDPEVFPDPEEFRPERFLETDPESGAVRVRKVEEFVPFGVGRRVCLGRSLAEREVFYAFSSLLHAFHLEAADPAGELPSLEPLAGVTLTPRPFEISLRPRNDFAAVAETELNMAPNYFSQNARTYG